MSGSVIAAGEGLISWSPVSTGFILPPKTSCPHAVWPGLVQLGPV